MHKLILSIVVVAACATPKPPPTAPVPELAVRRALMIQWLHEYAEAGVFPTDSGGMPLSVFRDARGVRCPMAELIHRSGHDELVDAVAREHNTLRLADVYDGPLFDWMLDSGLTLQEIAMVQGALSIDEMRLMRESSSRVAVVAGARGEVRGRLTTAETALRDGTSHALTDAALRYSPGDRPRLHATVDRRAAR